MLHSEIIIVFGLLFGFFMAWSVGANDVANAMGTSVGSNLLTIRQAVIIAAIFEAAGALLASNQVTHTIRSGIVDIHYFSHSPELFLYGMLAALLSAATWLSSATHFGWPVSTTHSIIGALIGFGLVSAGPGAIHWSLINDIFLSWILTPMIAGLLAYFLFVSVHKLIIDSATPLRSVRRYLPGYMFIVLFTVSAVTLIEGLRHIGLTLSMQQSLCASAIIGLIGTLLGSLLLYRIKVPNNAHRREISTNIEKSFGILTIFTACSLAFAHGSNDVANAIGPLAAIIDVAKTGVLSSTAAAIPLWIPLFGTAGIIIGLSMCGHKVISTVGNNITLLTPSRAFAAQLATALTVVIASRFGLPISTTQTLVGAVLGVGLARGISALNLRVVANIFISWCITLPAGAIMAIAFFYLIRMLASI